jgi:hypothetical protein
LLRQRRQRQGKKNKCRDEGHKLSHLYPPLAIRLLEQLEPEKFGVS